MRPSRRPTHKLAVVCALLFNSAPAALAQTTDEDQAVYLDEITVTARRRDENLQETPVAVTAITAATLQARGIDNLSQIADLAPNLSISNTAAFSGSTSTAVIFLRGFGQTDFALTTEPGVGVYLDGIYAGRSIGSLLDLGDTERLEVLRGPQGTLFGKNAIGGALNVTINKPNFDAVEGFGEVTVGRFGRADFRSVANLPVNDSFALRANVGYLTRDGYAERIDAGDELAGRDTWVARLSALWEPTENLSVLFTADGSSTRGDSVATTLLGLADGVFIAPGATEPIPRGALFAIDATLPPGSNPITFAEFGTDSVFQTRGTGPNFTRDDIWGVSGTVQWQVADKVSLKSITAYRDVDSEFGRDPYGLPFPTSSTLDEYRQQQFTQEIQVSGEHFSDRLKWVFGGFYLTEDGRNLNTLPFVTPLLPPFTGAPQDGQFTTLISGGEVDNYSVAVFGEGTFSLTEQLSVTAGLRYSYEEKEFDTTDFQFILESGFALAPQQVQSVDYDDLSPRVSIEYRWTDDVMTYLSLSSGFKGGGFVQRVFPGSLIDPTFELAGYGPETAFVYEAGLKSEFLDNRVRFNAATFYTDYEDAQIVVLRGFTPFTVNGGEVEIIGFEMEFQAAVTDSLMLSGNLGFLDAEYKSVSPDATEVTLDSRLPYTSEWTLGSSASYIIEGIADVLDMEVRADWSYRSSFFTQSSNEPITRQDAYHLLDISATLTHESGWSVQAGARNALDEEYLIGATSSLNTLGFAEGNFAPPRQWFLAVRKDF